MSEGGRRTNLNGGETHMYKPPVMADSGILSENAGHYCYGGG
jgi:hypothetical protein